MGLESIISGAWKSVKRAAHKTVLAASLASTLLTGTPQKPHHAPQVQSEWVHSPSSFVGMHNSGAQHFDSAQSSHPRQYENYARSFGSRISDVVGSVGTYLKDRWHDASQTQIYQKTAEKARNAGKKTVAVLSTFIPFSWGAMPAPISKEYSRSVGLHPHTAFWTSVLGGDLEAIAILGGVTLSGVHVPAWAAWMGGGYFAGMLANNMYRVAQYIRTGEPIPSYYSPIYGSANIIFNGFKHYMEKYHKIPVEKVMNRFKESANRYAKAIWYGTLDAYDNIRYGTAVPNWRYT